MEGASYGFSVDVPLSVEETEASLRELLDREGFGVLTVIDVTSTLKARLGIPFRPYRILGACNAPLAHRALKVEPGIGLLLPCNVVVESSPASGSRVWFLDPERVLGLVGNPELGPIAADAARRLRRVAAGLSAARAG